jgi:hypothetical protein
MNIENQPQRRFSALEGLIANTPNSDHADKLMLFGQFVGDWEVDFTVYERGGSEKTVKAEWHFGWVLEGRAIQDVFIVPRRTDRDNSNWTRDDYGTCLRFYDPTLDYWRVVWVSPRHGEIIILNGQKIGDEIVLEGKDLDHTPMRWIFSNINSNSFHWRRVFSTDGGTTWQLHKEMIVRRVVE